MNYEGDLFVTKDFYFACFLKAKGIKLERAFKEANKVFFYFKGKQEIKKLMQFYFNGNENVVAIDFVNAIRDLKTLSYNL